MDISSCWLVVVILHYCLIGHPQTGPNARFHINLMPKFPPVFVCDKNQSLTLPPSQMICECAHKDLSWILSQAFGMFVKKKTSGPLCFPRATTEGFCAHCKGKLLLLRTWNKMPGYQLLKGNISTERKGTLWETGNGNNIIHLNLWNTTRFLWASNKSKKRFLLSKAHFISQIWEKKYCFSRPTPFQTHSCCWKQFPRTVRG